MNTKDREFFQAAVSQLDKHLTDSNANVLTKRELIAKDIYLALLLDKKNTAQVAATTAVAQADILIKVLG